MEHRLEALSRWLATFGLHARMQDDAWIVPAVQTVHILAIGFVFSSALILALRALGVSGIHWSPARWGRRLNAWTGGALAVLLASGAVLIVGEPARSLLNPIFQTKMLLVTLAAALSWLLAGRLQRRDGASHPTGPERGLAVLVVVLWAGVIACGRWIAYYAG